jgi:carboxyl-terminal processing protease
MFKRLRHLTPFFLLLAVLAWLVLAATPALAEPQPQPQDQMLARMVCLFLQRGHLSQPEIGDEISKRLFQRFLKDFDPAKLYFLKGDIDEFRKFETQLDDMLLQGDVSFAYLVYGQFIQRVAQRLKLVKEFVTDKHDFTVKEYLETDPDTVSYASTDEEVRERWRKRIKFDLLLQRLGTTPVSEAEAKQKVLTRYQDLLKRWKQLDNFDLLEMYLTDLSTSVDPHSAYMSPATLDDFDMAMRLNLDGIGALLRSESGQPTVVEIVPGGPAAVDGRLKPKDKIVGVSQGDGPFVDVVDMKLREVVKLVRGRRGTKVRLKVIPAGKIEPVVIDLTRQKVELKNQEARGDIVEQGQKADGTPYRIGVIDLPSFYADTGVHEPGRGEGRKASEDVRKILKTFATAQVDGVILDLRYNGGGSLTEALALTGLFIDRGPVVQVRGTESRVQQRNDPEKGIVYAGPLMVLVSRFSASASEILAGALQDYGRALIVGDSATHGKGTVQLLIDLGSKVSGESPPRLGALRLTIQQFYRVNGDSTQNRGVASDVVLPSLTESLATAEKDLEHPLPFDFVKPAEHEDMGLLSPDLKAVLRERSAQRVKESADFAKLTKDIALFNARKARKTLPLNEQELRAQLNKDEMEKIEKVEDPALPDPPSGEAVFKFKRNFTNNEILKIMEDFLQGRKLAAGR